MEPERRIEKWLRAFAKKRREQAGEPMELRAPIRERLQREVARRAEEKSRSEFFSQFFFGLRPSLAFAVCFLVLAAAGWFIFPELSGRRPATLSMNELSASKISRDKSAPTPTPPPAPTVALAPLSDQAKTIQPETPPTVAPASPPPQTVAVANRKSLTAPTESGKQVDRAQSIVEQKAEVTTAGASAAPASNEFYALKDETAANSLAAVSTLRKDADGALPTVAPSAGTNLIAGIAAFDSPQPTGQTRLAMQKPAATEGSAARSLFQSAPASAAAEAPMLSQSFIRQQTLADRRRAAGTTATAVLDSFRVEQNGNTLKVVDADGSIYTGSVQIAQQEPPAADFAMATRNGPIGAAAAKSAPLPSQQNYFFRVAGTNRHSKQNVIFSGNFVPLTNGPAATGTRAFGGIGGRVAPATPPAGQPVQAVLTNSQINGNVVVGDQKAVKVIANPAR